MAICGVYGVKGKMGISNETANQNESLPLKKYATYLLTITTGTFSLIKCNKLMICSGVARWHSVKTRRTLGFVFFIPLLT